MLLESAMLVTLEAEVPHHRYSTQSLWLKTSVASMEGPSVWVRNRSGFVLFQGMKLQHAEFLIWDVAWLWLLFKSAEVKVMVCHRGDSQHLSGSVPQSSASLVRKLSFTSVICGSGVLCYGYTSPGKPIHWHSLNYSSIVGLGNEQVISM